MNHVLVVGAGHALKEHYLPILGSIPDVTFLGLVDPNPLDGILKDPLVKTGRHWKTLDEVPDGISLLDTVVMVLTPDHFSTIEALARRGFKNLFVEKPLVSRHSEIDALASLIAHFHLRIYSADFYLPKLFPLQVLLGMMREEDPRRSFVAATMTDEKILELCRKTLFPIEGISVQILEAGSFCLPDLAGRPWLENDLETGGMLRDLGTHAFAPLISTGLLACDANVEAVNLSRISTSRRSLVCLKEPDEVELCIQTILSAADGTPVEATFGKVPFSGGLWSLVVRGPKAMFYAGLRTGQPSVFVLNSGDVITFHLTEHTCAIALKESLLYFRGALPGFDGNIGAFAGTMKLIEKIRSRYFSD